MDREEILKKVIEKTVEYGYITKWVIKYEDEYGYDEKNCYEMLFEHSFCKAMAKYIYKKRLWEKMEENGDIETNVRLFNKSKEPSKREDPIIRMIERLFKIQLVFAEDRLEYIARFL